MPKSIERKTYLVREVAAMTGATTSTIRNWIRDGFLGANLVGGIWLINCEDAEALIPKRAAA